VIAPTRELATQIAAEIRMLSKFTGVKMVTVYGGVSMHNQIRSLRQHPDIVIGCPGRMLDLLQRGVLDLRHIDTLVLDEADHMFDMGFLPDIRKLIKAMPARRQNLLFSATMPKDIRRLADEVLRNPHVVELADLAPASTVDHALFLVAERRKQALLQHVLTGDDCHSAIVFTRTKHRARRLAEQLIKAGHRAVGLQGNMSQSQRDRAMGGFRSRRFDILVATDIAARGIDVSGVSHVINYDVPNTPEAYTHRIGRTGRAELEGVAYTFVTGGDHGWVQATERMIGSQIPCKRVEGFEPDTVRQSAGQKSPGQKPVARRGRPRRSGGGPKPQEESPNGNRRSVGHRRGRGRAA
ncbi:MAG: DEAD/DEAH box helicase, partial [Gemmatimonadota bacterium]|nr:DEAD/DEAH box helicase [Gemmatimonadota bacterium]